MYSAYKLNKQGDNIQPWRTPFLIWKQSVVPCPVITVASWPAYRFLKRQVRWSGTPISFRIFQFILIHTVKGFGIVMENYSTTSEFYLIGLSSFLCHVLPHHVLNLFSCVWLSTTLWTAARQAPLSMGFSWQEFWSGFPCLPPGDLPNSGIKITSLTSNLHQQAGSLPLVPPRKPPSLTLYLTVYNTLSLSFPFFSPPSFLNLSLFSIIFIFFLCLLEIFTVLFYPASHLIKEYTFSC